MKSCLSFDFLTPNLDQQHTARLWIQAVLQVQLPDSDDLYTSLRDGVFLCKLINNLIPNSVPYIFFENNIDAWTKNIQQFLTAAEQIGGLDAFQLFDTVDLLYGYDMIAVARTLSFLHDRVSNSQRFNKIQQQQQRLSMSHWHSQQYQYHRQNNNDMRILKRRYTVPFGQKQQQQQPRCLAADSDNRSHLGVIHVDKSDDNNNEEQEQEEVPEAGLSREKIKEQEQQRKSWSRTATEKQVVATTWGEEDEEKNDVDDEHQQQQQPIIIPDTPSCSDRHSPAVDSTSSGDSGYGTTTTITNTAITAKKRNSTSVRGAIHLTSLFNPPPSPPFQEVEEDGIDDEEDYDLSSIRMPMGRTSTVGRHERLSTIDLYGNNDDDDEQMDGNNRNSTILTAITTGSSSKKSATSRLARLSSNLSFRRKLPIRQKIPFHMRYQEWTDSKLRKEQAPKRRPSLSSKKSNSSLTDTTTTTPPSHQQAPNHPTASISTASSSTTACSSITTTSSSIISNRSSLQQQQYPRMIESSASSPLYNDHFTNSMTREQEMIRKRRVSKMKKLSVDSWGDPSRSRETLAAAVPRRKSTGTFEVTENDTNDSGERLEMRQSDGSIVARYKLGNTIGKGQFGTVHRALNLNTGQMVAIKRIKLDPSKIDDMDEVMQEAQILRTLSHANIVKYEGFIQTSECMNIVLEFVENGSLASTLKAFGSFPENLVASYCLRILKGLAYLHQERVVHCDLKAANILTTKNGDVKLSDFGVSVNLKLKESLTGSVAGTPNWMAPEVIELQGASTKSDIWSLGCTVIELYTGKPPYADLIPMTTLFRIVEDDCPPLPENGPDDLKDFLRLCFRKVPKERPTAVELLDHPWILRHNHDHQPSNNEESNCNNLTVTEGPGPHRRQAEQQEAVESRPLSSLYPRDFQYSAENVEHRRTASGHQLSQHPPSILVNKLQERQEKGRKSPPIVREHCFIKGSFPKGAIRCKACQLAIRRNALVCEDCGFICHDKCKPVAGSCRSILTDNASIRSGSESSCSSSNIAHEQPSKSPRPTSSMSSQLRERTRKLSKVLASHRRPHSTRSHDTLRFIREDEVLPNNNGNSNDGNDGTASSNSSTISSSGGTKANKNDPKKRMTATEFDQGTMIRNSTSASYAESPKLKGRRVPRRSSSPSEDCVIS